MTPRYTGTRLRLPSANVVELMEPVRDLYGAWACCYVVAGVALAESRAHGLTLRDDWLAKFGRPEVRDAA